MTNLASNPFYMGSVFPALKAIALVALLVTAGSFVLLLLRSVRYHRRMACLFERCANGEMSPRQLFLLARRDPEVREALVDWGKRDPEFLETLRDEGLYP
jgi:hypothetical protein